MNTSLLQSKKFVAYMLNSFLWKVLLGIMMFTDCGSSAVDAIGGGAVKMAAILVIGFLDVSYLAGQSVIDKYVRVAELAVGAGRNVSDLLPGTVSKQKEVTDAQG